MCQSIYIHSEETLKKLSELRLKVCLDPYGDLIRTIPDCDEVICKLIEICHAMDDKSFRTFYSAVENNDPGLIFSDTVR